jgi:hypothetical protein
MLHFCAKYPKYLVVPETIDNFATSNVRLSEKKQGNNEYQIRNSQRCSSHFRAEL